MALSVRRHFGGETVADELTMITQRLTINFAEYFTDRG
jgi:hypothetical protein